MILVDTSVWIDHLRRGNARLVALLEGTEVLTHPFVIGELACGNLKQRDAILEHLGTLPQAESAEHAEVLAVIRDHRLHGRGLGWIDAHLLASALLTSCRLWSHDKALRAAAAALKLAVD